MRGSNARGANCFGARFLHRFLALIGRAQPRADVLALGLSDVVNDANFLQQTSRSCS